MRFVYILIGLLLIAGAAGYTFYRFNSEPQLVSKYERTFERGVRRGQQDREFAPQSTRSARRDARRNSDSGSTVDLAQMALDIGNLVVGLIGIFLALRAGRGSRQTQS